MTGAPVVPVTPIRGQVLYLLVPAESQPSRVVWGSGCYAVPWRDGTLLVGTTVEDVGFDESSTVAGVNALTSAAARLLPASAAASLQGVRVGLRPAADGGEPFIGPAAGLSHVTLATGHYRNGILLAPITALMVAEHVLSGTPPETGERVTTP